MMRNLVGIGAIALMSALCAGCGDAEKPADGAGASAGKAGTADKAGKAGKAGRVEATAPPAPTTMEPVQEALAGGPFPALILSQAWFWKDASGRPKPGPARLQIWRQTAEGWQATRLEDGDSNVFHKALWRDGKLLTIAGEKAALKVWTHADGAWTSETLWEKSWGGKFNRLRDLEIADVDGDGKDEYIVATHDAGVVAVIDPALGDTARVITELDQTADTFVHEIEVGDLEGDGKLEFFATPSGRNKANASQDGQIVMYAYDGATYKRTVVDPGGETHAKECLSVDIDGDGKTELFGVMEAKTDANKKVISPVEIRQYTRGEDGSFTHTLVGTIDDRQTRFLVPGDFDGDGQQELVAASMKTGVYFFDLTKAEGAPKDEAPTWKRSMVDPVPSGFENATIAADVDGDGKIELYIASDDQRELNRYVFDGETWKKTLLGRLEDSTITWNIEAAKL